MKGRLVRFVTITTAAVLVAACAAAAAPWRYASDPPTSTGTGGAAASVDRLASQAALTILAKGGNAVDAAVAAAAVLGVTEPFSCGIGGGGFMVVFKAPTKPKGGGHVYTLDHRERAPLAMRPESFMENAAPLAFNDARYSGMSVGVPGTVRGWTEALGRYGSKKITLAQALAPAIAVARNGFPIDQTFFDQVQGNADYFDDVPATAALYLDADGTPRDVGTVFKNPDLAKTYELLAKSGANAFYAGAVANAIVQTVKSPPVAANANHRWRAGVMELADLQAYTAKQRPPVRVRYRGLDVFGMGPPSSGASTIAEALNLLEPYNLGALPRERALHLFFEASRFAFADRGTYVADPDFFKVPLKGLLSKQFAAVRGGLIGDAAGRSPVAAGDPAPFDSAPTRGEFALTSPQAGSTTHLTVADAAGNVVSYTFTIESTGGAGLVAPGYGFLLNNELTDFNFDSTTHPNRVEGGKRPRSSMAPTIVLKNGKPLLALGSPGGSMIITTVLQILVERLDLGRTLADALAAPRASQRNTAAVSTEASFLQIPEITALRNRGHTFAAPAEIGAATAIEFLDGGRLTAVAEPVRRGGGSALVAKAG